MKERILIVDDEVSVQKLIRAILTQAGYECSTASDAGEARGLLASGEFDLALCDILMPGESGLTLIEHISETYPDTAVVMVSGVDDPELMEKALEMGVYGYIVKPFEPNQIVISAMNALKRRDLEIQARTHMGRLEELVGERTKELQDTLRSLEQAHSRYRNLFESSLDAIYVVSMKGDFLEINSAGLDMLGYTREEIKGLKARDTYADPEVGRTFERRMEETGFARDFELRLKRRDGMEIDCLVTATLWGDESGCVAGYQGILRNITEQKRIENQLRQAHRENTQLLAAITSLLVGIDSKGRIIRWNKSAEETLGIRAQDVLNRLLEECVVPWDWEMIREGIARSRVYQTPVKLEDVPFTRQDGTRGYLGFTLNPILFEDALEPGLLIMGADKTEKRLLEVQLTQAQRLEAIGQLAAGIAHEINTPIQYVGDNTRFLGDAFGDMVSLLGKCEDLIEAVNSGGDVEEAVRAVEAARQEADLEYLKKEVPAAVDQTLEGVERVTRIVRSMKEFSHPGAKEMVAVDLNRALENTITVARNEWKYVADMETDFDPSLPPVPCLPGELNQVFLNLIINAAHAVGEVVDKESGDKGLIRVATTRTGDLAEIRISDTGRGIPEEIQGRVFDPFFTTKEVGKGTGQGLAISRSVVTSKHNGSIRFETEEGRGTTFIVRLPLDHGPPDKDASQ